MATDSLPKNGAPPVRGTKSIISDVEANFRPRAAGRTTRKTLQTTNQASKIFRKRGSLRDECRQNVVPCQGFTIREYVAKVRSVNIRKCWPFTETLLDNSSIQGRNPPLPPLDRSTPNRWWSCQHCVVEVEEHMLLEAPFDRHHTSQNCSHKKDVTLKQQLKVALETFPSGDTVNSQHFELEGQMTKLRTVQISGKDDGIADSKDGGRCKENKEEMPHVYCRSSVQEMPQVYGRSSMPPPCGRAARSKFEKPKRTGNRRVPDVRSTQKPEICDAEQSHQGKTVYKENPNLVLNVKFDVMEKYPEASTGVGSHSETAKVKRRVPKERGDQTAARSVSMESERNKFDNLHFQQAKLESIRHGISDISNAEGSGLKICPVCKTFSSATITAVNAHMDNCLAQHSKTGKKQVKPQKQKSRARKKRSIVDICAAVPPVQSHLDPVDNIETDRSAVSSGIDIKSDDDNCNGKEKENVMAIETVTESGVPDESPDLHCDGNQGAQAQLGSESGKAGGVRTESLEMKRKRQRLGLVSRASGSKRVKELAKMPSAESEQKQEQPSNVQLNIEHEQFDNPTEQLVRPAFDTDHSADISRMLQEKEEYKMEHNCTIPHNISIPIPSVHVVVEQEKTITREADIGIENVAGAGNVSQKEVKDLSVPPSALLLAHAEDKKGQQTYHVQQNNHNNHPGDGDASNSNTCPIQNFEGKNENCKLVHKETDGLVNLNPKAKPKVSVLLRDCRGRFVSSSSMNGALSPLPPHHKQSESRKSRKRPKSSVGNKQTENNSADINAYGDAALSNPIAGKSTSTSMQDFQGGKKVVAQQIAFSSGNVKPIAIRRARGKQAAFAINAMDFVRFCIDKKCSDYGYIGLPVDSQGELIKHIPNARVEVNGLYKFQSPPGIAEGSRMLGEFNFVEGMEASHDVNSVHSIPCYSNQLDPHYLVDCKQPRYGEQFAVSKANRSKPCKIGFKHSCFLDQTQRDKSYPKNSNIRIAGSSTGTPGTSSNMTVCTQATVECGYDGDQRQQSSVLELRGTQKEQHRTKTTVMRLMGQNVTIKGENGEGKEPKEFHHRSRRESQSNPEAPVDAVSSMKSMRTHMGHCITCTGQFYVPPWGVNALCLTPEQTTKISNISDSFSPNFNEAQSQQSNSTDSTVIHEVKALNNTNPKPVEKKFPTNCTPEQSLKGQYYSEQAWIPRPPFSAPFADMFFSTVSYLSNNTSMTDGDKVSNNGSHIREQSCFLQNQMYRQNINSCLVQQGFQQQYCTYNCRNQDTTGNTIRPNVDQSLQNTSKCKSNLPQWLLNAQKETKAKEGIGYEKAQYSPPLPSPIVMESVAKQVLCPNSRSKSSSDALQAVTCYSTSFPTAINFHCQIPASSAYIVDSATLMTQGKYIHPLMGLPEGEKLLMSKYTCRNRFPTTDEKGLSDIVNLEGNCQDSSRKRKSVQNLQGLEKKCPLKKHEDCAPGSMQKRDLFSTTQKFHKPKRAFPQQIKSSNLVANHLKSREMSGNGILDIRCDEICRTNHRSLEFSIEVDRQIEGNACNKVANETILTPSSHIKLPQKLPVSEALKRPNNNHFNRHVQTSTSGVHYSNGKSSLKLAEPIKLSGGAKHILKPSAQNQNAKQSLVIHYTVPFSETTAEQQDKDSEDQNRWIKTELASWN